MNESFLNHKLKRRDMSYLEGEDNISNNLKEVCSKIHLLEKMLLDEDGVLDSIIKIDKKIEDTFKYGNDSWLALKARMDRIETSLSGSIEAKKNSDLGLVENVKEEEEEVIEDDEEEEKEDVLNVTPNPEDDIKVDN
jgi:hypothetical protein